MDIKVKHCNDCPFWNLDYDDWAVGNNTTPPEWCSLKEDKVKIKLKK